LGNVKLHGIEGCAASVFWYMSSRGQRIRKHVAGQWDKLCNQETEPIEIAAGSLYNYNKYGPTGSDQEEKA